MPESPVQEPIGRVAELSPEEQHFLWLLTKRSQQSVVWNPPRQMLGSGHNVDDDRRKIATLCVNLPDPLQHLQKSPTAIKLSYDDHLYVQVIYPKPSEVAACVRQFLSYCKAKGSLPRFVLLNELACSFEDRKALQAAIGALAVDFGVYIAAGSYHCPDSLFNIAPVVTPRGEWAEVKKQNSAARQQERIRTPDSRYITTYSTEYGNFVLWICLDIYDPALMLKFINATYRFSPEERHRKTPNQDIHMVLVPSYSGDDIQNISECLRLLAKYSKTVVLCANAYATGGQARMESLAYLGGDPLSAVLSYTPTAPSGLQCVGKVYEYLHSNLLQMQATDYISAGTMSTQFAAILGAANHTFREIPEDDP